MAISKWLFHWEYTQHFQTHPNQSQWSNGSGMFWADEIKLQFQISWLNMCHQMSPLNITQPLGIWSINVYNGYFFRWCPIFPKWDIYQPLLNLAFCSSLPSAAPAFAHHRYNRWRCHRSRQRRLHFLQEPVGSMKKSFLDLDLLDLWVYEWSMDYIIILDLI